MAKAPGSRRHSSDASFVFGKKSMQNAAHNRTIIMKMKTAFFTVLVIALLLVRVPAASLNQTIASINSDAKKDPAKAAQSLSASIKVPVATLEKEKTRTNLSYGDLFAAHSIAKASGKSFDEVAAMKSKGQTWDKIAETLGVSLDGKKNAQKPMAKATPSPTPHKSLFEEQKDRYK
jgi:hypothetical protein